MLILLSITMKTSENRGILFMTEYFDICGTRIAISAIKDFRTIQVEFIFRPVFRESKKLLMSAISGKNMNLLTWSLMLPL